MPPGYATKTIPKQTQWNIDALARASNGNRSERQMREQARLDRTPLQEILLRMELRRSEGIQKCFVMFGNRKSATATSPPNRRDHRCPPSPPDKALFPPPPPRLWRQGPFRLRMMVSVRQWIFDGRNQAVALRQISSTRPFENPCQEPPHEHTSTRTQ